MRRDLWAQQEIFDGGAVKRFHTWPIVGQQTVAEHSWGVLAVIDWLYEDASAKLLRAAIHHDVSEFWTGDVPFQVKRLKPEIKTALIDMEEHHCAALNIIDMDLDEEDRRRLKVADYVECMFFCIAQKNLGNQRMNLVMDNLTKALYSIINAEEREVVNSIINIYYDRIEIEKEDHA